MLIVLGTEPRLICVNQSTSYPKQLIFSKYQLKNNYDLKIRISNERKYSCPAEEVNNTNRI